MVYKKILRILIRLSPLMIFTWALTEPKILKIGGISETFLGIAIGIITIAIFYAINIDVMERIYYRIKRWIWED